MAPLKENQYWNSNNYWFDEKRELWLEPNNNPLLPEILNSHYCARIELLVTDRIITVMNQYWCGNVNKATKSIYFSCPTCPKNNPEETVHTTPKHFKLPNRSFKVWQMDFIHLTSHPHPTPSHRYKSVLVIICVFPLGQSLSRLTSYMSLQCLILLKGWGGVIPAWETPLELRSDWRTSFTGQILRLDGAIWPVL